MAFEALAQIEGLDVQTGKNNCMDDEALYVSVIGMYKEQLEQDLPKLKELFDAKDWINFGRACHGIKGASASVGAVDIQQSSAELEQAGKTEDGATIEANINAYLEQLQAMVTALSAVC